MSLNSGSVVRSKRTATMENSEGNELFTADSQSEYSHVILVEDEPVVIRGHHMDVGDELLVEIVDGAGGGEHFSAYKRKGQQVKLTHKCNVTVLSVPGRYRLKLVGALGTVYVNSYKASMTHDFLKEALEASCCTTCDEEIWVDTGLFRCKGDIVEKQQESQTGAKRWVEDEPVKWVDTGNIRCNGDDVEKQQVNQCGQTQWVADGKAIWTETGISRCNDDNLEVQEVNQCGLLRWVVKEPIEWTETEAIRCTDTGVEVQEKNQCGQTRWRYKEELKWTETGAAKCTENGYEVQESNQCGLLRWVVKSPIEWTPTGEQRCANNLIEVQEINQCGFTRWRLTDTACDYDASYPLPGYGFMYQPGDAVDPEATVEMNECNGTVMGWLYPTPRVGATVAVRNCQGEILGYARNRSETAPTCNPDCDGQTVNVSVHPTIEVALESDDGGTSVQPDCEPCEKESIEDAFGERVAEICVLESEPITDAFGN